MAFGKFAFVSLGDEYFAYGAMAGLISAALGRELSVRIRHANMTILQLES